jgi:hypothetical protein
MGIEEGEEVQAKGTDNILNKITADNIPNLEKERVIQLQETFRKPNWQFQKRKISRLITVKIVNM